MSAIIVPPIRAPLTDPRGGTAGRSRTAALTNAQTTKEWYLFFEKLARGLQRVNASVNQGTHEERLATAPGNVPDGALWVETDRGNVVYQVQQDENGEPVWVYLAGTMTGTLTPDERPDDLGEFDAGFQFVSTDTEQIFLWDGTAWVDITSHPVVTYGTHAERLAFAADDLADGAVWVETDRGHVIYQIQSGVWHYLAGTMFGTLVPDQRPADLGVNDAGFDFRTIVPPAREFLWSQTAWVEVTPITGAANLTHPDVVPKVGPDPGTLVESGVTDNGAAVLLPSRNMGVGINSPVSRLHVNGAGNETGGLTITDAAEDTYRYHVFRSGGSLVFVGTQGSYSSYVFRVNSLLDVLRLLNNGGIALPLLPASDPGAGSKQLWFDPADGNRVKFAP